MLSLALPAGVALGQPPPGVTTVSNKRLEAASVPGPIELVQAVTMASTWGSWSILRQHMGLGVARARAVMTRTLTALLSADGPVGRRTPKGRT